MQPDFIHPGLGHRLLVAAARAHHHGETPLDWNDIARLAAANQRPRTINRALAGLANDGLIEGVHTPAGWLAVHPTDRGVRRAGRAAHRPAAPVTIPMHPADPIYADADVPVAATAPPPRRQPAAEARERIAALLTPRVAAARTTLSQAWHTFTTLP